MIVPSQLLLVVVVVASAALAGRQQQPPSPYWLLKAHCSKKDLGRVQRQPVMDPGGTHDVHKPGAEAIFKTHTHAP